MRKILLGIVVLLVVAAAAAGITLWRVSGYMHAPLGVRETTTITVDRGHTLKTVLGELETAALVTHPRWVYAVARFHDRTTIRAGMYDLTPDDTPLSLLDKLAFGKVKTEQFVVVEGRNRWTLRDELVEAHWMTAADFDRLCNDAAFLAKHGIPGPTCEGYLFPETYTLARGLAPEAIFAAMLGMFQKVYKDVTAPGRGPLDFDMRKVVTLASIVEKETGAPDERPHIACVFYNRLKAKPAWKLETDPTVIYAATLTDPAFDGNLKREHLHGLDSPYNTYRVHGLPPGPIANPGRAALQAVVTPVDCPDFFFVSMNNGTHVFCPTLGCHTKAVEQWQVRYFKKAKTP
jgi:UPF0755 protein